MCTEETTKYRCAYTDAHGQQTCDAQVFGRRERGFDKVKKTECSEAGRGFGSCAGGIVKTTEDKHPAGTLCSTHQAEVAEAKNDEDDNEYGTGSGGNGSYHWDPKGYRGSGGSGGGIGTR